MRAYVAAVAGVLSISTAAPSVRASELIWEGETGCEQQGQLSFELERAWASRSLGQGSFHFTSRQNGRAAASPPVYASMITPCQGLLTNVSWPPRAARS